VVSNVIVTPRTAGAMQNSRTALAALGAENIRRRERRQLPRDLVGQAAGY
jgi:phosphoglycerate dehydrogenase-like enzyme